MKSFKKSILKKGILLLLACFLLQSCKSKAVLVTDKPMPYLEKKALTSIENHYKLNKNFKTLYIKANAKYADAKQTQNVGAEIKIKKNEQVLISVRVLGITMAKISITPTQVSFYEKLNRTYFEGDYSFLSEKLGVDLNYSQLENLLLGEATDVLSAQKYTETLLENVFTLEETKAEKFKKTVLVNASSFEIESQKIEQLNENRVLSVAYKNYANYPQSSIPQEIKINATQTKGTTIIELEYKTISFDEELSFPYSIPDGYKKIIIK